VPSSSGSSGPRTFSNFCCHNLDFRQVHIKPRNMQGPIACLQTSGMCPTAVVIFTLFVYSSSRYQFFHLLIQSHPQYGLKILPNSQKIKPDSVPSPILQDF
jgi:hypothetical protein